MRLIVIQRFYKMYSSLSAVHLSFSQTNRRNSLIHQAKTTSVIYGNSSQLFNIITYTIEKIKYSYCDTKSIYSSYVIRVPKDFLWLRIFVTEKYHF